MTAKRPAISAPTIEQYEQGPRFALSTAPELSLDKIRADGGTQARAGLDDETVEKYAAAMREGAQFPLIVVYHDGTDYWLADGFHRVAAALQIGRDAIRANVQSGTRRDAVLYAMGANDTHGLPRRREDLQRSIARMLADEEWKTWSDRRIAEQVHCDHKTVAAARARVGARPSGEFPQMAPESRTVKRGGTTYQQKVKQAAPARPLGPDDPVPPPQRRGFPSPAQPAPPAQTPAIVADDSYSQAVQQLLDQAADAGPMRSPALYQKAYKLARQIADRGARDRAFAVIAEAIEGMLAPAPAPALPVPVQPPPSDPREPARAWLAAMRVTLARCPDSTMFRLSEMIAAADHVQALLDRTD